MGLSQWDFSKLYKTDKVHKIKKGEQNEKAIFLTKVFGLQEICR